jgi:hypothetical protein
MSTHSSSAGTLVRRRPTRRGIPKNEQNGDALDAAYLLLTMGWWTDDVVPVSRTRDGGR